MVILHFKTQEFFDYLIKHGCKQHTYDFVKEYDAVVFEKDGLTIPIKIKKQYYSPLVCRVCNDFDIPIPPDHLKVFNQLGKLPKSN